jgi:hypothetical protein
MRLEALFATHSDVKGLWPNTRGWVAAICRGSEGVVVARKLLRGVGLLYFYQSSSKGSKGTVKQVESLSYGYKPGYVDPLIASSLVDVGISLD